MESSPTLHHVSVHDAADQLLRHGPPGPLIDQDHWTYDDAGNRVTEKLAGVPITTFGHDEVNQLETVDSNPTPDRTLAYDANGSCVSDAEDNAAPTEYVRDAEDRLIVIKTGSRRTSFRYDAIGRRIAMTESVNGGGPPVVRRFAWCGARLCAELDPVSMTPTNLLYPEGEYTPGAPGIKRFYARDDLGSIRYMTDENAAVKAYYRYDPWGRESLHAGTEDAAFGFAGYHAFRGADRVPDLYLTWYRAYDPTIGRWLSRDPIGEFANGGTAAQDVNLYAYVANSPLSYIDPLGLWAGSLGIGVGASLGLGVDLSVGVLFDECGDLQFYVQPVVSLGLQASLSGPGPTGSFGSGRLDDWKGWGLGYLWRAALVSFNSGVSLPNGKMGVAVGSDFGVGLGAGSVSYTQGLGRRGNILDFFRRSRSTGCAKCGK